MALDKAAIFIPARYGSTRFPGKPLALIDGQTMLSRVVDNCRQAVAGLDEDVPIYVTSDHDDILAHCRDDIGVDAIYTPADCPTGTDRVYAAAASIPADDRAGFILSVQGDTPFTPPSVIAALLSARHDYPQADAITPCVNLTWAELDDLRSRKQITPFSGTSVVMTPDRRAMWFSKQILPALRDEVKMRENAADMGPALLSPVWRHIGIYGYAYNALAKFVALPPSHYEGLEGLEQLRLIENGMSIFCVPVQTGPAILHSGIDSPEDVTHAETILRQQSKGL